MLISILLLSGCEDKSSGPNPEPEPESQPGTKVIGPKGGDVTSDDGNITISIPPNVVKDDTTISVSETSDTLSSFNWGSFVGPRYSMQPHGIEFEKSVRPFCSKRTKMGA